MFANPSDSQNPMFSGTLSVQYFAKINKDVPRWKTEKFRPRPLSHFGGFPPLSRPTGIASQTNVTFFIYEPLPRSLSTNNYASISGGCNKMDEDMGSFLEKACFPSPG